MRVFLSVVLFLSFLSPFSLSAAPVNLSQTGQTIVDSAGDDGDLRIGKNWPNPRFVDNSNGSTTDSLTGLVWSSDANIIETRSPEMAAADKGAVTWQNALDSVRRLNSERYLGYSDWRLPNVNELASLLNQGDPVIASWLSLQGIVNCQPSRYWTSSTVTTDAIKAWAINLETGSISANVKSAKAFVWTVRTGESTDPVVTALPKTGQTACFDSSGKKILCRGTGQDGELRKGVAWPSPRFGENSNETITDYLTGLIWVKNTNLIAFRNPSLGSSAEGRVVWPDALDYVNRLNREAYLGYTDWRLPNRNELVSLINYAESNPAGWLNLQGFSETQQHYWSSGTSAATPANAWDVSLSGTVSERNKFDAVNGSFILPVRGGLAAVPSADVLTMSKTAALQSSGVATVQAVAAAAATLSVTTASLPAGTVGTAYSQTLAATGGTSPYTWSKKSGSLPAGLTLSTAGVISGTPTTAATSTFTVQVKDKTAKTATKSLTIVVSAGPLAITTATLADGYLTTAYSQTLTATGGKTAYTWSITSGTLPAGITLAASTGKISGTPTTTGISSITVQVKDANNSTVSKALTISVYGLPTITTASLPAGSAGAVYNQTLTVTGGKASFAWSISTGTLPAGLALNTTSGAISGTPTTSGTNSITVKVTDANAKTATKALSITINATPPSIATATLLDGYVGVAYSQTLTASGGKTPYTWSRTVGTLPSGLSLSSAGVISGTPTVAGTSTFTAQVKDGNNATATASLAITVIPGVTVTSTTLSPGSVGSFYNQSLAASGGKMPYIWSVIGGTLPTGLTLNAATGAMTGTPSASGSSSFTVQVKDANNKTATGSVELTIKLPVTITTTRLHDDFSGIAYSTVLSATGGVLPYSWSITAGSLPAGLSLDRATGTISGTPTSTGNSSFTVQVSDVNSTVTSKTYGVTITNFGSIDGRVTDQASGVPLQGVTVKLDVTDIQNRNSANLQFSCASTPIATNDYGKLLANDDDKLRCDIHNSAHVKIRNPYGVTDPFTLRWNGLNAYIDYEYLSQSFKPTRSGTLNRVSLYLSYFSPILQSAQGRVYVLLKSSLGGDNGVYLARSNKLIVSGTTPVGWVDFDFTTPVSVTAGQEYFIELQGAFAWYLYTDWSTQYDSASWGYGGQYADGDAYIRSGGIWEQMPEPLAFRTYVAATPDIVTPVPAQSIEMRGAADYRPGVDLVNIAQGAWDSCDFDNNTDFFLENNSGDYNCVKTVTAGSDYYDQDGWISVYIDSSANQLLSNLVTDQFLVTFNRTLTTVTDANGAYSFPGLPDGNYSVSFTKPAYSDTSATGILPPGATINLATSISLAPPATIHGTITSSSNFVPAAGVTVMVTDQLGSKIVTSDFQGNYRISDIVHGNYSITFSGAKLQTKTITGTIAPGQDLAMSVAMDPVPITLIIASPVVNEIVAANTVTITGSALGADTVTITMYEYGSGNDPTYATDVTNDTFAVTVPLASGKTWIKVNATSKYGPSVWKNFNVTRAAFMIKNLGDTGNVTVMEYTGGFDGKNQDGSNNAQPRMAIATEYFKTHSDVDFLVYLTTFDYTMPGAGANGFYLEAKNDTQGIGRQLLNNSAQYSSSKLQGTIDLGNVTTLAADPYGPKLDETVTIMNHELMHRFGAYVKFKNPDGTNSDALLGKDNAHWSYLLDSKGSHLYGNAWTDNSDGSFTATAAVSSYSPLDLYLMGMISKEQVPPMLLIDNPVIDKTKLPEPGATITGTAKTITIDDIIAAEGARVPDAAAAQKEFTVGFVLLTRQGDNATAATQAIETVRKTFAGRFAELTRINGHIANVPAALELNIASPAEGATVTGPEVTVTGIQINTTGAKTSVTVNGIPATVTGSRFAVDAVPLTEGLNTLEIKATDVNGLTTTTTRSITATSGYALGSVPGLIVGIATPANNATVAGPEVSVTGIVINSRGTATSVTVNGNPANVTGNRFAVDAVPLTEGLNTLELKATDVNGLTTTTTRSITATSGYTLGSVPGLIVGIATPANNATVAGPEVSVTGIVINSSGAETGVTVNGIPALVTGNRFVMSAVPLTEGLNTLEIKATDVNGLTATTTRSITATSGYTIGSLPGLIVGIATPSNNAIITGPDVSVTGIVFNSSGAETGVTVNGIPATVTGSRFIANHVPLQEGSNTLTITAIDANGLTTTATRSVTAQAGHYIRISSNVDSGTGPLDVSLRLDGSFIIDIPTVSASGPVPAQLTVDSTTGEYTAKLAVDGTYTFTASATGPDGQTYSDSVMVTVVNRNQLEVLLQGKWEGVKAKIAVGDIEGTVQYFASAQQADFRETFTEVGAALIQLPSYMNPLELVYTNDSLAKCRMMMAETISGQLQQVEYVVYFIQENGTWKLRDF